jgi:hypothetical protein
MSRPDGGALRVSRRAALWTGATGLAAALVPARASAQTKIAPKLVQYQEKPKGPQECDNCLQFVAPAACKLVDGKINPKGWCQLYAAKPK